MTSEISRKIVDYRDGLDNYKYRYNALGVQRHELDWYESKYDVGDEFWERKGIASIGELALVVDGNKDESIRKYSREAGPTYPSREDNYPDLTHIDYYATNQDDDAKNDFEERLLIFSRISNLVTVRSDVFTAYILVRLGTDGPQKRMIAILDRSDVTDKNDKVRILALQAVPDPR
jgi:hypothetical protein